MDLKHQSTYKPRIEKRRNAPPGLFYRLVSVLVAALVLINCSLVSNLADTVVETPAQAPEQASAPAEIVKIASPELPPPPSPLPVPLQDPEQTAGELARLLAGPDNLAAWLGLYQALGIPVIGMDHKSIDGSDDPIGPAYWQVWYTASLDQPGRGIRLEDAGKLLGLIFEFTPDESQPLGEILLSDLRSDLNSQDPSVHLLAALARERILRVGMQQDILDSATTAQAASIDVPTLQLIFWVLLRQALFERMATSSLPQGKTALVSYPLWGNSLQSGSFKCSEMLGNSDATYWFNWMVNKISGGGQLPGMQKPIKGMLERVLTKLGMGEDTFNSTSKALAWANVAAGAVSFLMQLASMDVVGIQDPDKLERTKNVQDGKTSTITWRLASFPDKIPNGNEARQCFLSFVTNALGVGFSFPPEGVIAGAELQFSAGKNIPDRVYFGNFEQLRSWTDQDGQAELLMLGKGQKMNLPSNSKAKEEEFSVRVSAQPEEAGVNSMVNIFFNGLTFGVTPTPAGFTGSMIDVLKTFTYDMGEFVFPMIDWYLGFTASGGQGISIIGTICGGLTTPFQLEGAVPDGSNVQFTYQPASEQGGSYTYNGSGGGFSFSGTGTYTIAENDDETLTLTQTDTRGCVTNVNGGCREYVNTITLTPIESCTP